MDSGITCTSYCYTLISHLGIYIGNIYDINYHVINVFFNRFFNK